MKEKAKASNINIKLITRFENRIIESIEDKNEMEAKVRELRGQGSQKQEGIEKK